MTNRRRTFPIDCSVMLGFGAILFGLGGCATHSQFVRVKNPFVEEKELISRIVNKPVDESELPPSQRSDYYASASSRTASPALFGEAQPEKKEKRGFFRKSKPRAGEESEGLTAEDFPENWEGLVAESEISSGPVAAAAGTVERDSNTVLLSEGTLNRKTGGKLCYPCNGKGFQLDYAGQRAAAIICPICSGTGRDMRD